METCRCRKEKAFGSVLLANFRCKTYSPVFRTILQPASSLQPSPTSQLSALTYSPTFRKNFQLASDLQLSPTSQLSV